jgi:RHS repeat-associated protein
MHLLRTWILAMLAAMLVSPLVQAQKSDATIQYIPPRLQVFDGVLFRAAIFHEDEEERTIFLGPIGDPVDVDCKTNSCPFYVEVIVSLNLAGTDNRHIATTDEYDVEVEFQVKSAEEGFPSGGMYPSSQPAVLNLNSANKSIRAMYPIDYTPFWRQSCSELTGVDDEIRIIVKTVTASQGTTEDIKDRLRFEAKVILHYQVHPYASTAEHYFTTNPTAMVPVLTAVEGGVAPVTENPVNFTWNYPGCSNYVPAHELQVLRLFNESDDYRLDAAKCSTKVDWNKAQRVIVYSDGHNALLTTDLTIAEGSGWYLWRVRPIGNWYESGIANDLNYGVWSAGVPQDAVFDYDGSAITIGGNAATSDQQLSMFVYDQFDVDKNWSFQRAFYEDRDGGNGAAEQMTFATSALVPIQQQSFIQSTGDVLVQQTVLDYQGRPLLQSLPVPKDNVLGGDNLSYVTSPMGNGTDHYTASKFDAALTYDDAEDVDGASQVAQYWGAGVVPDDGGYPFVRTLLSNDPLAQPIEQTSAGNVLNQKSSGSHTTKTQYASATENELVIAFGNEAPLPSAVRKVIVTDPNGVVSYTYLDRENRTIATCLSDGTNTEGALQALPVGNGTDVDIADTLRHGVLVGKDSIYQSMTLVVSKDADYSFTYFLLRNEFGYECFGEDPQTSQIDICGVCDYTVTVRVRQQNATQVLYEQEFPFNAANCPAPSLFEQNPPFEQELSAGTYIIERIIRPVRPNVSLGEKSAVEDKLIDLREEHQTTVEAVLKDILSGDDTEAYGHLQEFRKYSATNAEEVEDREEWAKTMLKRYQENRTREGAEPDTTVGCCSLVFPVIDCVDPCAPGIDYEQMLFDAVNALPSEYKALLEGNFTTATLKNSIWYYGGGPLLVNDAGASIDGEINALIENMIDPNQGGYDCEQVYACWQGAVQQHQRLAFLRFESNATPTVVTHEKNLSFNLLDYFLDCVGTKYCSKQDITETVTENNHDGWVELAWKILPEPSAGAGCPPTPDACDGTNNAVVNVQYQRRRACYAATVGDFDNPAGQGKRYTDQFDNDEVDMEDCDDLPCVKSKLQKIEDDCKAKCESHRLEFRDALVRMHLDAGRMIIGHPDYGVLTENEEATEEVSWYQIMCTVNSMVEDCRQSCDLPIENIGQDNTGLTGITQQEIDVVMEILAATSFEIVEPDGSGNCPTGDGNVWRRVQTETRIADLILDALNEALKKFESEMTTEWATFDARDVVAALGEEFVDALDCLTDITLPTGWWGTIPAGQTSPSDPFRVLVRKGDTRQIFYINADDGHCQIRYNTPDKDALDLYGEDNPHPLVKVLNQYLEAMWGSTVDDDILNEPAFDNYNTLGPYTIGSDEVTVYEIVLDGSSTTPFWLPGLTTNDDPTKPKFGVDIFGTKDANAHWQLEGFDLTCLQDGAGNQLDATQLSALLNIKSYVKCLIRVNQETELHVAGVVWIQPCSGPVNIPENPLYVWLQLLEENGILWGTFQGWPLADLRQFDNAMELIAQSKLSEMVEFRQTDDGLLYLTVKDAADAWSRPRLYEYECLNIECPDPVMPTDTCHNFLLCNVCDVVSCADICFRWAKAEPATPVSYVKPASCAVDAIETIIRSIEEQLNGQCLDEMLNGLTISYFNNCLNPDRIKDGFTYTTSEYLKHFTLYYYDRAGRLVKTVPPEGVDFLDLGTEGRSDAPSHEFVTRYAYNTLGQMTKSVTPDGGLTEFWYNAVGQLRLSRNAQQILATPDKFSYMDYDDLGRVIEVGQRSISGSPETAVSSNPKSFGSPGEFVTQTTYTSEFGTMPDPWGNKEQENLLNRISYTITDTDGDLSGTTDDQVRTYYSYDPHGNVNWLIQDIPGIDGSATDREGVLIEYTYDLISGRVVEVRQNRQRYDQVMRRYAYDADGRVISTSSSLDGYIWDTDATYDYYRHGPLKRVEIGQDDLQGMDYIYTINGWLKGINVATLSESTDPGGDGHTSGDHQHFGRDAFGMELHYHSGDYSSASNPFTSPTSNAALVAKPLYNGNIAGWAWNSRTTTGGGTPPTAIAAAYTYDVLNRIVSDKLYDHGASAWSNPNANYWATAYTYDGNGNILSLQRHDGSNGLFDNLTYNYYTTSPKSNRLEYIGDNPTVSHPNDIEDQPAGNYQYDAIGNLIADDEGDVTAIFWTPANKIDSIVTATAEIGYLYDAAGNRVRKQVWDGSTLTSATWYVRDPQGNALSIYTRQGASGDVHLSEVPLYGSDRLGMIRPDIEYNDDQHDTINRSFSRIAEQWNYELKDHNENVRVVISDELQEQTTGVYLATVVSRMEYYPFGMPMHNRSDNLNTYRFSFNGGEADDDVLENQPLLTFEGRTYSPATARYLSPDPSGNKFPQSSPYESSFSNPIMLTDLDGKEPSAKAYKAAAEKLGVSLALIRAFYKAEVGNTGYLPDGRIKILFERHIFRKYTGDIYSKNYPDLSGAYKPGTYGGYAHQYTRLSEAVKLDPESAYKSISISGFQIMGFNFEMLGFKSATDMYKAITDGNEDYHLTLFVRYITSKKGLIDAMKDNDYAKMAFLYNGPRYKDNSYDAKIKSGHDQYRDDPLNGLNDAESGQAQSNADSSGGTMDSTFLPMPITPVVRDATNVVKPLPPEN